MSLPALGVFRSNGNPASVGLSAAIGQLAVNILTGNHYIKTGSGDTAWDLTSTVFLDIVNKFTAVALQSFTASGAGTYTPTSGMKYCLVISTGAGGGGGGADTDGTNGTVSVGAGGGAGGTCIEVFDAATIGSSQALSVGAGGTAGSDTGGDGAAGGNTTFGGGPLHTANGGSGGLGNLGTTTATAMSRTGAAGGGASNGTINISGGGGGAAMAGATDGTTLALSFAQSGFGGISFWGGGARARVNSAATINTSTSAAGNTGEAPGCGGSGAICQDTTTGAAGGAGAAGIIVVIEFLGPA